MFLMTSDKHVMTSFVLTSSALGSEICSSRQEAHSSLTWRSLDWLTTAVISILNLFLSDHRSGKKALILKPAQDVSSDFDSCAR